MNEWPEPLVAFVGRGEDEPPERPHVFRIVDENGVEREVYAPPGHVKPLAVLSAALPR